MKFWMVSNPGVCQVESLVIFGATSKRNSTDKRIIGTFGSGVKQSICLLLRKGLNPVICSNGNTYEFGVKQLKIGDQYSKQLQYTENKKNTKELSVVLDYGEQDWHSVHMACREFVSNAIDACYSAGLSHDDITIKEVYEDEIKSVKGYTSVYIPQSVDSNEFFNNIDKYFLHFGESNLLNVEVIDKKDRRKKYDKSHIYRRGVFVREIEGKESGLFDYNFPDLQLDECRNYSEYGARTEMAKAIGKGSPDVIEKFLKNYGQDCQERTLDDWYLSCYAKQNVEKWNKAIESISPDAVLSSVSQKISVEAKGKHPILLKESLLDSLKGSGIKTYSDEYKHEESGYTHSEPTDACVTTLDKLWEKLEQFGLTNGKIKPEIMCFEKISSGGTYLFGIYQNDVVYVHKSISDNVTEELVDTIIHELAHHITGATDESKDYQSFVVKLATKYAMSDF